MANLEQPPFKDPVERSSWKAWFSKLFQLVLDNESAIENLDHGSDLAGLSDDDHTQYSLADGTRDYTGKVSYDSHPTFSSDTEIVDKKYVDDNVGDPKVNPNLLFNGAMQVWQRGTSFTATEYTADRWESNKSGAVGITTTKDSDTPNNTVESSIKLEVTTSGSASTDYSQIGHRLETQDIKNSGWDYESATSYLTLTFWAKSSLTGTYHGYIRTNNAGTTARSYSFSFDLTANTWTQIEKQIPGDTGLTLDSADNDVGLELFILAHYNTNWTTSGHTAETWQNYDVNNITEDFAQDWLGTNGNTFFVTKVKLEIGDTATDFVALHYAEELLRCQRYYYRLTQKFGQATYVGSGHAVNSTTFHIVGTTPTAMRTQATGGWSAAGHLSVYNKSVGTTVTSITYLRSQGGADLNMQGEVALGLALGQGVEVYLAGASSGYIEMDAEL